MEYLIGGLTVWILSGALGVILTCMPWFDGDKWEGAPAKYCVIALLLGPITHYCSVKAYNSALFKE